MRKQKLFWLAAAVCVGMACSSPVEPRDAVILVTLDGLRWQDLFHGADTSLMNERFGGMNQEQADEIKKRFWVPDIETRQRLLMPFFWEAVAGHGILFGNGDTGNTVRVTNNHLFSYPGYNEILAGKPDSSIDSNSKMNNENVTVLEWIHDQPGFGGQVAAFASWDVFPYIINEDRSGVLVDAGWEDDPAVGGLGLLGRVSNGLPRVWPTVRFDALTVYVALAHYQVRDTRVLYIALDETDTQAHEGRYDLYLDAMHRLDAELRHIWEAAQAHPAFGGRTTLIVTSDHGRGRTGLDWTDHGVGPAGADETWLGIIGPYTPALGIIAGEGDVTLAQVAATVAAAVGLDFHEAKAEVAPAIDGVIVR